MHARGWPVRHTFAYPVYFYALDLDELPELGRSLLFGHNRLALAAVHDRDYLHPGPEPMRQKVLACLGLEATPERLGRVMLVTSARFLGYVFNPVSFFYCHRPDGELMAALAFVNNTFGESHLYTLKEPLEPLRGYAAHFRCAKAFHVSPFFDRQGFYDFHLGIPGDTLDLLIHLTRDGEQVFAARLTGSGRELTHGNLLRTICRQPFSALITVPRITWEAAKLYYRKKLPVHHKPNPDSPDTIRFIPPSRFQRLAMNAVLKVFAHLHTGGLKLTLPDRRELSYGAAGDPVAVTVRNYDFFRRIATRGDVGLGEAYMAGDWSCAEPTAFLKLLAGNADQLEQAGNRFTSALGRAADWLLHRRRANTVAGSRRNIRAHYDLSNEFFQQFLDESMTYSCGVFSHPSDSLEQAQQNKIAAILRQAQIGAEHHVLEVGCGWGAFAIAAARQTGCRVTGITVSEAQFELAVARVRAAGLQDRIEIKLCDYRQIEGQFDRIVSIEMLEAVGHQYLGAYFHALDRALKPNGRIVIQVITIPDQRYERYCRGTDFIKKHIFPGGHLPSLGALAAAAGQHSGLTIHAATNIGEDYALTLNAWRRRFLEAGAKIRKLGFDDEFIRKWEYYFCYCEAGFATRLTNNLQLVMRRVGPQPGKQ